jgi:acetolactate synthase I/III small subunit
MSSPRTVVALMQNRPGVLNRTVGLLRSRNAGLRSLAIGDSEVPGVARLTLVVDVDDAEHVVKQLNRLIEVLEVKDVTHDAIVERETALMKITAPEPRRGEVHAVVERFAARVIESSPDTVIVEATDTPDRLAALIRSLRPFGVREITRSGRLAMTLGADVRIEVPASWQAQADGIA